MQGLRGLLLVALVVVPFVYGTSDSDASAIFNCDARSPLWGCSAWTQNDRLRCTNNTNRLMHWAAETVPSSCYRLRAGVDENSPVTSYVPNQILHLHLRVTCWEMEYRGILAYAVNGAGVKVGDWQVANEEPFVLPFQNLPGHNCQNSLMHASADLKPYYSVFQFRAPPAGTGSITFQTLIKQGNANHGAFFWPNNGIDLTLTEGPVSTGINWQQSEVGQSCHESCAQINQGCSEADLHVLSSPDAMIKQVGSQHLCNYPILSGCGQDGASKDLTTDYCYYADQTCAQQARAPLDISCATKSAESARFCSCSSDIPVWESSASSNRLGFLTAILLAPFLLVGASTRFSVLLASVVLMASYTSGHNWLQSNSRASGASTTFPCPAPLSPLPHAQVGPGQSFQIEWMNGHGFNTYFSIVHSRDADKLKLHTEKLLKDYIDLAPPTVPNMANTTGFQRLFRKTTPGLDNVLSDKTITDYFLEEVLPGDPRYLARPDEFAARIGNTANSNIKLMAYRPDELAQDARVSYQSEKYPWIEAVYRFRITSLQASRPDVASFIIPGFGGPGRYIVQYLWRGYRDCTDVDLKAAPVESIYGHVPNTTIWNRIDHCLFQQPRNVYEHSEIVTDPGFCLSRCQARGVNCYGVNVVPLRAPATAYSFNDPTPASSWRYPQVPGADIYVPWGNDAFNKTRDEFMAQASPQKYMCYAVRPREPTDTMSDVTTTDDPTNPIFYSTCYYRFLGRIFSDYENNFTPANEAVPWRFTTKCIDCETQAVNSFTSATPTWDLANTCINCDKEPVASLEPTFHTPAVVSPGVCDGYNNFTRTSHHTCPTGTGAECIKRMLPLGRLTTHTMTREECGVMATKDPECSNHIMFGTNNRCWCYTNVACCKGCSRKPTNNFQVLEVVSTPDPTCATGVLSVPAANSNSTIGDSCCSGSCTSCDTVSAIQDQDGFCSRSLIPATRLCSMYGPPCKME